MLSSVWGIWCKCFSKIKQIRLFGQELLENLEYFPKFIELTYIFQFFFFRLPSTCHSRFNLGGKCLILFQIIFTSLACGRGNVFTVLVCLSVSLSLCVHQFGIQLVKHLTEILHFGMVVHVDHI